ncbi:MAG: GNAT family N-acetyltransferase [Planctomycetota bacterium]|jgi:GNAT superfamily N-acetyltransferase
MTIRIAETDDEIRSCYGVVRELRSHLSESEFVARVERQAPQGYRLAFLSEAGVPVCAAGFRLADTLAWGRFLYVDDLVTASTARSRGHGRAMLAWLLERARAADCAALHLDSGTQRADAHRFYEREGLDISSYHFQIQL